MRAHLLTGSAGTVAGKNFSAKSFTRLLQLLNSQLAEFDDAIAAAVAEHPDAHIFANFPGVGRTEMRRYIGLVPGCGVHLVSVEPADLGHIPHANVPPGRVRPACAPSARRDRSAGAARGFASSGAAGSARCAGLARAGAVYPLAASPRPAGSAALRPGRSRSG